MEDRLTYIDCLLNIALCQPDETKEYAGLEKTRAELEKYYPTFADV